MMLNRSPIVVLLAVALAFTLMASQASAASAHGHKHAQSASTKKTKKAGKGAKVSAKISSRTSAHVKSRSERQAEEDAASKATAREAKLSPRARARTAVLRRQLARQRRSVRGRKAAIQTASIETRQSIKLQPTLVGPTRLFMPPPMRGTHESLVHQNLMAEQDGLERILDDEDLADRIAHGSLVPVPSNGAIHVNTDLPENRRYCRPWTAKFLSDLAAAHGARFSQNPIEVTSAVRTVEFQRHLRTYNGNAAAAEGDIASPHLTGGTIDIAKQGMTKAEIGWLRAWLIPLEQAGKIDVAEEFRQACFHISVYKSYVDDKADPKANPKSPMASASMLAVHGR